MGALCGTEQAEESQDKSGLAWGGKHDPNFSADVFVGSSSWGISE